MLQHILCLAETCSILHCGSGLDSDSIRAVDLDPGQEKIDRINI
jgi:hypothetical protein